MKKKWMFLCFMFLFVFCSTGVKAENRFFLANGKIVKQKPVTTPQPTYKPIVGKKVIVKNIQTAYHLQKIKKQKEKKTRHYSILRKKEKRLNQKNCRLKKQSKKLRQISESGFIVTEETVSLRPQNPAEDLMNYCKEYDKNTFSEVCYGEVSNFNPALLTEHFPGIRKWLPDMNVLCINEYRQTETDALTKKEQDMQSAIADIKKKMKSDRVKIKRLNNKEHHLNDMVVFDPKDITIESGIRVSQMKYLLKGTALSPYAELFVRLEKKFHVNAVAYSSLAALESNWGMSRRAIEDHNYTGFGVYQDFSKGINAINGKQNLTMTCKHLHDNYLQNDAMYYHGTSLLDVNQKYAASKQWAFKIEKIAYRQMNKLKYSY